MSLTRLAGWPFLKIALGQPIEFSPVYIFPQVFHPVTAFSIPIPLPLLFPFFILNIYTYTVRISSVCFMQRRSFIIGTFWDRLYYCFVPENSLVSTFTVISELNIHTYSNACTHFEVKHINFLDKKQEKEFRKYVLFKGFDPVIHSSQRQRV